MFQRKTRKNYQNLPEGERSKKREYNHNRYRKLFVENELSEEEKKRQYACNLYNDLPKEKIKRCQYGRERYRIILKKL